jgi:hypothetical protein
MGNNWNSNSGPSGGQKGVGISARELRRMKLRLGHRHAPKGCKFKRTYRRK